MYKVSSCTCCGKVKPGHDDPYFPEDAPFERKHLIIKYHPAWQCKCNGFCKGSQFFCAHRPTHINYYKLHHNGQYPWEFLECDQKDTNSLLCDQYHKEVTSENLHDLKYARSLSRRNGFGIVPLPPSFNPNKDIDIDRYQQLYKLLSTLTAAEEAAIQQISPMISIVRLAHGNIGCKGNTSCV